MLNSVKYEESVWLKIRSERGREALYIGCVYMPTDVTSVSVMDSCYERLGVESVVNRVAKCELGEKMIVCGRAAGWWDVQIKDKINARKEVYKKVVNGREDLWGEYCRLRKEVKTISCQKGA